MSDFELSRRCIRSIWRSPYPKRDPENGKYRNGDWSLLLPSGWRALRRKSLEKIAVFQWRSANEAIVKGLQAIDSDRWMDLSYGQMINDPAGSISKICRFCGVSFDQELEEVCNRRLSLSRYTLSPPSATKWHKNAALLKKLMPGLGGTLENIQALCPEIPAGEFDYHIDASLTDKSGVARTVGQYSPCPCGSGKKYKRCHGVA